MTGRGPAIVELAEYALACENGRFAAYLDHIRASDGYKTPDYLVVAPEITVANLTTGVAVLPCGEIEIGLVRLHQHPIASEVWEVPRGLMDANEPRPASTLRELEEKTGLTCPQGCLLDLGTILPEAGVLREWILLFAALECKSVREFTGEELSHREFHWFTIGEVRELLRENCIKDAATIATPCVLYRALPRRH